MNIFYTDPSPLLSAKVLDDRRLNKMIVESAQMLSTAVLHYYSNNNKLMVDNIYKQTHKNHPCSIWTRISYSNYNWLLEHLKYLCSFYNIRFNKIHKTSALIEPLTYNRDLIQFDILENTLPPKCNPYKDNILYEDVKKDVVESYRLTLLDKWSNYKVVPRWNGKTLTREEQKQLFEIMGD